AEKGIYNVKVNFSNQIPGTIFIKVFENKHNSPISNKTIAQETSKRIGWSTTPNELFFYYSQFKILEGSLNKPIDGRIEIWFKDLHGHSKIISSQHLELFSWNRH
ncbi:MAG: hypothetical protein JEZ09_10745, partial [Salinivirgaceae bacterium]|nr:hypothetical protein [Salinivirgaceae bacterium]